MATSNPISTRLSAVSWRFYLGALGIIAIVYRTLSWQLLPPGLATTEASGGVISSAIAHGTGTIGFHGATGYSPLWELLQSASILIFGSTASALRIVTVVISLIAVAATYAWANSWYDRKTAWVSAFLMAVLPWSVTLSRNALSTIFAPLFITALLWSLTKVMRNPSSKLRLGLLAGIVILALAAGPWGWLALGITTAALVFQRKLIRRSLGALTENKLVVALVAGGTIVIAVIMGFLVAPAISKVIAAFDFASASAWFVSALRVIGMFFYHGDPDFHHNLGGEPMLNAFIGLAFVTGLLVSLSRIQRARDRILLIVLGLGLMPAVVSAGMVPNAARASIALPVIAVLASIGAFYLLELWSTTFPINSAARSLGQTAIALLLVLTAFQSYTQYFTAWANSNETYIAYNRAASSAVAYSNTLKNGTETTFIGAPSEIPVASYLSKNASIAILQPEQLKALPTGKPRRLIITSNVHDAVVTTLEKNFPGGTLKAHLDRDGSELFYDYVITK